MSGLSLCDLFATDVRGARLAGAPAEERVRETCEITPAEADEEAQRCYGRRFEDYGRWQGSLTGDDLARVRAPALTPLTSVAPWPAPLSPCPVCRTSTGGSILENDQSQHRVDGVPRSAYET